MAICSGQPYDRKDSASTLATKTQTLYTEQKILEPDRFNHFSLLNHLKPCIVQVQRAIERLRPNKKDNWRPTEGPPTVTELSQAGNLVLRSTQHYHYQQEINTLSKFEGNDNQFQDRHSALKRNSGVRLSSNLHKLDPFIDKKGLL